MSTDTQVAIVGGGLSGLHAARLMREAGADLQLFEARDRLGGRILTVDDTGTPSDDGFDLGPSWIWPRMQPALGALVRELGLPAFGQTSAGDVVFERMSREPPQRSPGRRMDQRARAENTEPMLAAEPIENAEAREPAEPIDSIEPAEPIDRIEPAEPIDRIEPLDPMLRMEPEDPAERDEPGDVFIAPFCCCCRSGCYWAQDVTYDRLDLPGQR